MVIIDIKLTKHQTKQLQAMEKKVDVAYRNDKPGAIVAQFFPKYNHFRCAFYTHEQMIKFNAAFEEVK